MDPTTQTLTPPAPSTIPVEPKPKSGNLTVVILSLLLVSAVSLAGYFYYQNQTLKKLLGEYQSSNQQIDQSATPSPDPTTNWKTYTNDYWKISFKYPDTSLTPCPDYTTEKEGIRFWGPNFGCPSGHDIFYKIGFSGYDQGKYIEPRKPFTTEEVTIGGKQAQKKTYIYDESDGPLFGLKKSVEIVFTLPNGTIVLQQLGENADERRVFDQILSTFEFTE